MWNTGFVKNGLAFISDDQARSLQNVEVSPKDVLLNITGDSVARACQVDNEVLPARVNQHVCIIRPDSPKLDPTFLRYWLVTASTQHLLLGLASAGATRNALTKAMVEDLVIPALPIAQQKGIAAILSALDDKIEMNRRMNETLEGLARAIFKSWFVDFDPVRAKAKGRDPGLAPGLAALFPDRFGDDGSPEGWEPSTVGAEVNVFGGNTPSTKEESFWGGKHAFATPKDVSNLGSPILLEAERGLTRAGLEKVSSGVLPVNTVLMSSRAPIGYVAISKIPVSINQGFAAMVCERDIGPIFAYFWTLFSMDEIKGQASGSTFAEISKGTFRKIPMVKPRSELCHAYERVGGPIFERIEECQRESENLAALRDLLLPKLMSGEIRIIDAEKLSDEAGA